MNIDSLMYFLNLAKQKSGVVSYIAMPLENNFHKYHNYTNVISDDDYLQLRSSINSSEFFNLFKNEVILNNDGDKLILEDINQIETIDVVLSNNNRYIFVYINKQSPEIFYYFIPESNVEYWINTIKYTEITP